MARRGAARRGEAGVGGSPALPAHGLLSPAAHALGLNYTPDLVVSVSEHLVLRVIKVKFVCLSLFIFGGLVHLSL